MSFSDFFNELLTEQRNKGIEKAKERALEKNISEVTVSFEDCILTDEEFDKFLEENKHLINEG